MLFKGSSKLSMFINLFKYISILSLSLLYSGIRDDVERVLVNTFGDDISTIYYKIDLPLKLRGNVE